MALLGLKRAKRHYNLVDWLRIEFKYKEIDTVEKGMRRMLPINTGRSVARMAKLGGTTLNGNVDQAAAAGIAPPGSTSTSNSLRTNT